jgi:hypothetical protein
MGLKTRQQLCGYEAASPIIKTFSDLERHLNVGKLIDEVGGRGSATNCGTHIHLGVGDVPLKTIENFFRLCIRYESAFFMLVSERRQQSSVL